MGKVILGLFIILVTAVGIIHIPLVQEHITHAVANYLSAKIDARIAIHRIKFSILGNVVIEDVTVWDPYQTRIFTVQKIEVTTHILDLLTGDFIFDTIRLAGVEGKLIQDGDGMNIQFIVAAFQSPSELQKKTSTIKLQFNRVQLENSAVDFVSTVSGITVNTALANLTIQDVELSTAPLEIIAGRVFLQQAAVQIVSIPDPKATNKTDHNNKNQNLAPRDDHDFIVAIRDIGIEDSDFSFHQNQVTHTPKFDPSHIDLENIHTSVADFRIGQDTLAGDVKSLAARLPGFVLDRAKASIHQGRFGLVISDLLLASETNELQGDFAAGFAVEYPKDDELATANITVKGQVTPADLQYFFSDSIVNYFSPWTSTAVTLKGNYTNGKAQINMLKLETSISQLQAAGTVRDVLDSDKIAWNDLEVSASIGSDFQRTLTPFLLNVNLPPIVNLQLTSSGNPTSLSVDGKVVTPWGDVSAVGQVMPQGKNTGLDVHLSGEDVNLGAWLNLTWLGPMDLSVDAAGVIGHEQNIEINGLIQTVALQDQIIHDIAFRSKTGKANAAVTVSIDDPNYLLESSSVISFGDTLLITTRMQANKLSVGKLLHLDSALQISGHLKSTLKANQSLLEVHVEGDSMLLHNQSLNYGIDSMAFHGVLSPTASEIDYYTNNGKASLASNFDLRHLPDIMQTWATAILKTPVRLPSTTSSRRMQFNLELDNANLLKLLGLKLDEFTTIQITGDFDEQQQTSFLQATGGKMKGYGISLDTLNTNLVLLRDSVYASFQAKNVRYNSVLIGNLSLDILTEGDTASSNLLVSNDSLIILGLSARILPIDSGAWVYPSALHAFRHDFLLDPKNPLFIGNKKIMLKQFRISHDSMAINLNGDLNAFDASFRNVDLRPLNYFLPPDSTVIQQGYLSGEVAYTRDKALDLQATIDSLTLYDAAPFTLAATARSNGNQVPFTFRLTNEANKLDLKGDYFLDKHEVDASLLLDVHNLELFGFLVSGVIDKMHGTLTGETTIRGPLLQPTLDGDLHLRDVELTTLNPRLTFSIPDDHITLANKELLFHEFNIYDPEHHPLTLNGSLSTTDYQSFTYNLHFATDHYNLIHNPDSATGKVRGLLVIDSDITLTGNEKDTRVEAKVIIQDETNLTFVNAQDDIELLKADGIVDFIDPTLVLDSTARGSGTFYDSLIASLPDFNLNSTIVLEDKAVIRLLIDAQSGDYIEASGGATLELGYDRTGNVHLAGNYTITEGVYRLSFYDLVKKNFTLARGSSINWTGSPQNGDLDIKALHTVQSNSIGLIGHEIGENEKSVYKRSLDYQVGINIQGTTEKPIVSFSLDLPEKEKVNYPVLANKLDRLRQPEYQSELNKQVFGLLVLGGFLPETSGSDINSSLIATTALSNSVNSLLASQLNRFASQYIKGVNIDVGIQSYSDYSAPGGKTQTAMDFRVSKRIMDDRLSFEIGGDFDINQDQSGANTGTKNYRGDIAIIYDLTGNGDKQLKLFNNETYDIIYQEIRNTGISLIFIREFDRKDKPKKKDK
ncbi:MAG: translocation/assembly module TamB domain-containing protein [Cyclobacteriaceae bacterium]|nr:translocation/assembly module TamB domain-containing protein [Cyclobacteriaceae bacterium]